MFSKERVSCNRYRMRYLVCYYEVQLSNSQASVIKQPRTLNVLDNKTSLKFHSQVFYELTIVSHCSNAFYSNSSIKKILNNFECFTYNGNYMLIIRITSLNF